MREGMVHPMPRLCGLRLGRGCWVRWHRNWLRRSSWQRLALGDDRYLFENHRGGRFIVGIALDAGDCLDYENARLIALAEDGVVLIEVLGCGLGDEELGAVG